MQRASAEISVDYDAFTDASKRLAINGLPSEDRYIDDLLRRTEAHIERLRDDLSALDGPDVLPEGDSDDGVATSRRDP